MEDCRQEELLSAAAVDTTGAPPAEHDWVAATMIPVEPAWAASAARNRGVRIPETTWVIVLDVLCEVCRVDFAVGRYTKCPGKGDDMLRGGPVGDKRVRRSEADTDT